MEFDATFIFAAISFIVFVFIMNRIFYHPVLLIMKKRQAYVEDNYNTAKDTESVVQDKASYINTELKTVRSKVQSVIADKSQEIKKQNSKIVSEHKEETYNSIANERESLMQSAIDAKETLKDKVVDIAKNISSKLLGDDINAETIDKSQINEQENYE